MSRHPCCWEQDVLPSPLLASLCCQSRNWIFRLSVTYLFPPEPDSRYHTGRAGEGSYIHRCRISECLYCGGSPHSPSPSASHLWESCQVKFPQQKVCVYSPVWGPKRTPPLKGLSGELLRGGGTEAAPVLPLRFWLAELLARPRIPGDLPLLSKGLCHRTGPCPNESPWGAPATREPPVPVAP